MGKLCLSEMTVLPSERGGNVNTGQAPPQRNDGFALGIEGNWPQVGRRQLIISRRESKGK